MMRERAKSDRVIYHLGKGGDVDQIATISGLAKKTIKKLMTANSFAVSYAILTRTGVK